MKTLNLESLSEFIQASVAIEKPSGKWSVFHDGENMLGEIMDCEGTNEYQAKEDAFRYLQSLVEEIRRDNGRV